MKITILTLFPEMLEPMLKTSVIGRALEKGTAEVELVQIRDFAKNKHRHVDDTPFGGGKGMVMMCQPVLDALDSVRTENSHVIMMSPAGVRFDQKKAHEYAENGLLEYPQYTQPANYEGDEVPAVLLSGNHAKIREWRILQSLKLTEKMRPDLYEKHEFTEEEKKILAKAAKETE